VEDGTAIDAQALVKVYGDLRAVDAVDLHTPKGIVLSSSDPMWRERRRHNCTSVKSCYPLSDRSAKEGRVQIPKALEGGGGDTQ
jgi:hypothetical protein